MEFLCVDLFYNATEKYYRTSEIDRLNNRLKQLSAELSSINFVISLIQKESASCAEERKDNVKGMFEL